MVPGVAPVLVLAHIWPDLLTSCLYLFPAHHSLMVSRSQSRKFHLPRFLKRVANVHVYDDRTGH